MRTQSADTSIAAERVQIALLQQAPIWRKLELLTGLNRMLRLLSIAGARQRRPAATDAALHGHLAELWLGADLAARAYPQEAARQDREVNTLEAVDAVAVLLLVTEQLEALGVPYLLGGSIASGAHGMFRATNDADIVADITEAQATALAQILDGTFYIDAEAIREAIPRRGSFNAIHLQSMFKVDLFVSKHRAFDRSQMARRIRQIVNPASKHAVFMASPEDTVLAKLEWYRQGGEISDRQWNDVLGVLKVQAPTIDQTYLRRWAASLGLSDLLARAFDDAGLS